MVKAQDIKAGFTNQWYVVLTDARVFPDGLKRMTVEFQVRYRDGGVEPRYFLVDTEVPGEQGAK